MYDTVHYLQALYHRIIQLFFLLIKTTVPHTCMYSFFLLTIINKKLLSLSLKDKKWIAPSDWLFFIRNKSSLSVCDHIVLVPIVSLFILRVKIRMYLPPSVCTEMLNVWILHHCLHDAIANNIIIEENYPNCATCFLRFPFKPLERERERERVICNTAI